MNEKIIKLTDADDVQDFVRAAGNCNFYIDISYQRIIIEAKSILGVMGPGLSRELTVKYGGKDLEFENVLGRYSVA